MSGNGDEELVERALDQTSARRHPKAGLLHHSDRGSQYTSQAFQTCFEQAGITVSMSRKGNCWDNAAMESFFGTLKDECVGSTMKQNWNFLPTWKGMTIVFVGILRSATSARSIMSKREISKRYVTFDI